MKRDKRKIKKAQRREQYYKRKPIMASPRHDEVDDDPVEYEEGGNETETVEQEQDVEIETEMENDKDFFSSPDDEAAEAFVPHQFSPRVLVTNKIPTIFVDPAAYNDMLILVDEMDIEVGWLGFVDQLPGGNFLITDIVLPKQECSAVTTILDAESVAKIAEDLLKQPDGVERYNKLRFWGHSHVRMGTSPSGQDEDQMKDFKENGCEYFIRGILNKEGRMEFSVFYYEKGIKIVDCPWAVAVTANGDRREHWKAQLKDQVSHHLRHWKSSSFPETPVTTFGGTQKWKASDFEKDVDERDRQKAFDDKWHGSKTEEDDDARKTSFKGTHEFLKGGPQSGIH